LLALLSAFFCKVDIEIGDKITDLVKILVVCGIKHEILEVVDTDQLVDMTFDLVEVVAKELVLKFFDMVVVDAIEGGFEEVEREGVCNKLVDELVI
jgi:hypothetical protein